MRAVISVEDYLWFVDEALDAMVDIVVGLGDELANQRLDVPGANSPYAVLTHCLGVLEYWGGQVVAGRIIERDRDAEFRSYGDVRALVGRTRRARLQFEHDLADLDPHLPPRGAPDPEDARCPLGRTRGGALLHVYDELSRHRRQLEVTRDVLQARRGS